MDLIKTLLVYMIMVVSGAVQSAPAITPPTPGINPSATPYTVTLRPAVTATPTALPTATPSPTPTRYTSLYVGDRGDAVTRLQRRLTELGYLNDKIDGIFGKNTKAAVERFQYYNNLTVDGIAGQKTQAMLYESTAVVVAPPDVGTPRPTATPLRGVDVPIYYVNENSLLLYSTVMTCYGNTTIYANGNYVGANYELTSSGAVNVSIQNGVAVPASVTFRYRARATDVPTQNVVVPIYYQDLETGALLYSSVTAPLAPGRTHYITASASLAPAGYELVGTDTVTVVVSAAGVATPASVIFTFRKTAAQAPATNAPATAVPATDAPATNAPATDAPATDAPEPRYAEIPVYYMDEDGPMLGVSPIKVQYGTSSQVTPESGIVNENEYTLVSEGSVLVVVDENGVYAPDTITFTYRRLAPATDVPVLENGKITVELRLQGTEEVLLSYEEEVKLNSETQLYAKYESLDPKYVPVGDTALTVFVDASGKADPAPVFYFADTTPAEPSATDAPATDAPAPEPQYAEVPVRYMTEDDIVLGESAVKVMYGGTAEVTPEAGVVNENEFMLISDASVTVTADENGVCTPGTVVFTYRRVEMATQPPATDVPATAPALTEGGSSVQIDGNTAPVNWMKDHSGNPMISLRMLAGAAGWSYSGGNCEINGRSVAVNYDANGVYTLSVNGSSYAGSAVVFDNDLYVGLQFITALGYDTMVSGSSIVMTTSGT